MSRHEDDFEDEELEEPEDERPICDQCGERFEHSDFPPTSTDEYDNDLCAACTAGFIAAGRARPRKENE